MGKHLLPPKNQVASFDVDAQQTFTPLCPNELPVPDGDTIVTELNQQANYAEYRLGSKDAHNPAAKWLANDQHPVLSELKAKNYDLAWPFHAMVGTKGFELIPGLPKVTDYNYFVWKGIELDMHPYGACYHDLAEKMSTGVIEFLKQKNVMTVIIGGLAFEYCVMNTALQLLAAQFDVILNLAAIRGIDDKVIQIAKKRMEEKGAIFVKQASELMNKES